jgi:predicted O-methyltransferase YrrM
LKYAVLTLPRPLDTESNYSDPRAQTFRHAIFGWLRLRPVLAQHTATEHAAIQRWATGRMSLVEIGVAEGVSGLAAREVMAENATLTLIDPFHLSRVQALNFVKRAAHGAVEACPRGRVQWIEKFSHDAVKNWETPLDFLLIDGDHSEAGVRRDWEEWSPFVQPGGVAVFHDARIFDGGWPSAEYGPVKVTNRIFREDPVPGWKLVDEVDSLVVAERVA